MNNLGSLAEESEKILKKVQKKALSMEKHALAKAVRDYGGVQAKKFFSKVLAEDK